jgi:hypothetical protein
MSQVRSILKTVKLTGHEAALLDQRRNSLLKRVLSKFGSWRHANILSAIKSSCKNEQIAGDINMSGHIFVQIFIDRLRTLIYRTFFVLLRHPSSHHLAIISQFIFSLLLLPNSYEELVTSGNNHSFE